MKVCKVINNNVVSCIDEHGQEAVVMGRGLGFQAKPGMKLDESAAEKIFRMDSQEEVIKLRELIARIPTELLELCTRIVDYASQTLGRRLNQSIYLTLTDHIQFAIERCRQGLILRNALLTEVRVFYPEEYTIGCYALEQITAHMGLTLPPDEAASIALHLVNAEYDRTMDATMRAAQVLHPMVELLENSGLSLDNESLRYNELIIHLKFMAMESFSRNGEEEPGAAVPESFLNAEALACARTICEYLSRKSGNPVSGKETAYLAICIERAVKPPVC